MNGAGPALAGITMAEQQTQRSLFHRAAEVFAAVRVLPSGEWEAALDQVASAAPAAAALPLPPGEFQ